MIGNFLTFLGDFAFQLLFALIGLMPNDFFFDGGVISDLWNRIPNNTAISQWVSYMIPVSQIGVTLAAWSTAVLVYVFVKLSNNVSSRF